MKTIKIGETRRRDVRMLIPPKVLAAAVSGEGALARQMEQFYLSWFQQNTSAECSAKAAVDG